MNDKRRKALTEATNFLDNAKNLIEEIKSEEEDALENMPEGLKEGDKGEKAQAAIDALDEAMGYCDDAINSVSTATE